MLSQRVVHFDFATEVSCTLPICWACQVQGQLDVLSVRLVWVFIPFDASVFNVCACVLRYACEDMRLFCLYVCVCAHILRRVERKGWEGGGGPWCYPCCGDIVFVAMLLFVWLWFYRIEQIISFLCFSLYKHLLVKPAQAALTEFWGQHYIQEYDCFILLLI